jgi:NADH-quinone oxidoreductase subunit C
METITFLKERYGASDHEPKRPDLSFITLPRERLTDAVSWLKLSAGFSHLVLLTAVDWIEQNLFQLTYILNNPMEKRDLALRVFIDRKQPVMESIHGQWAQAATYQQELKEMFGIDFPGSPRQGEPFVLEGWHDIPPYRRDFDTRKYSEETYFPRPGRSTSDPREHMAKGYPQEET